MRSQSAGHSFPDVVPWARRSRGVRHRTIVPLLKTLVDRYNRPSPPSSSRSPSSREGPAATRASAVRASLAIRPSGDGFELDEHGRFRHVLAAPDALSSPCRPSFRAMRGPSTLTSHTTTPTGSRRRRRDGRSDRVGERDSRPGAGRPRASARAGAAPADRRTAAFACRGLTSFHTTGPSERVALLRSWFAPSYPPGPGWDEPLEAAARASRFRVAAELNGADQAMCHGVPPRLRA
jgi:hypothetical protein